MRWKTAWLLGAFIVGVYAVGTGLPASMPQHPTWALIAILFGLQVVVACVAWVWPQRRKT